MEELTKKKHEFELEGDKEGDEEILYVHIDGRTMGVGGYDSWTPNVDVLNLIQPTKETKSITTAFQLKLLH